MFNESAISNLTQYGTDRDCLPVFDWAKKQLWYVFSVGKGGYRYSFQFLCHVLLDQNYFIKEEDVRHGYPEFMKRFRSLDEMTKTIEDTTYGKSIGSYWIAPSSVKSNDIPDYKSIPNAMLHRDKKWALLHCKSMNYVERVYALIIMKGCYVIL
jgi:hypothetical protein